MSHKRARTSWPDTNIQASGLTESLVHPRDQLVAFMTRIYRYKLTTTSGGNLSIMDNEGVIWMTPKGTDKGKMNREQIVYLSPDGVWHSEYGDYQPSTEAPVHRLIYSACPNFKAILHAHAPNVVTYAITRKSPDTAAFSKSYLVCGEVGFAPYARPGSSQLAENVAAEFRKGFHCVILENHGVIVGAETLQHAFEQFETLEMCSGSLMRAAILGGPSHSLTPSQIGMLEEFFHDVRGKLLTASEDLRRRPLTSREKEFRRQLIDYVHRGYHQNIMASTSGTVSVRVSERLIVITPSFTDRLEMSEESMVAVEMDDTVIGKGKFESGRVPSVATSNHIAIYQKHSHIQTIINYHPPSTMAFAISDGMQFQSKIFPEGYIVLRDVKTLPFEASLNPDLLQKSFSVNSPVAIVQNDSVYVTGKTVLEVFDRMEVMESCASVLVSSKSVGSVCLLGHAELKDIEDHFFT